jgi:hypothetical protein
MNWLFIAGLVVLSAAHQDVWLWNDPKLVFGFLPVGLAYHAGYTLVVSAFWLWAVLTVWPRRFEDGPRHTTKEEG